MFQPPHARCRSALGLVAFAFGCAQSAPPAEAPLEAPPENAGEEPARMDETASAEAPSTETTREPVAPESATPAPTPSHVPRDTRGKEQIQQIMASNRDKVRACYDAALVKNPGIKGELVVDFVISPRGEVKQAEVNWSASEIHIPELDTCAVEAVRALTFPASSRGLESKVSYPFNFNPPRTDPPNKKP